MIWDLQKASIWKRASAYLFDMIVACILVVGFAFGISKIVNYDSHNEKLDSYYSHYENMYGIEFEISEEEYQALTPDELERYNAAYDALVSDEEALNEYSLVVNLTLITISLGVLLGIIAVEFVLPLIFGNGQTLGKKIFGLGVIKTNGVKINNVSLFIRTVLGKYTIETMVPVYIVIMIYFNTVGLTGTVILGLLALLELLVVALTKTHSAIHDLLADTVVIDISSQMIFDTENDLIEYKKKLAAEKAARADY
ncbi:MAG: RDD family protein [Clostridiales bacterium]|nr:RDD family protein [Clostridiales bacterium]